MFFQPKRIAIGGGYHGVHATIDVYKKSRGVTLELIDLEAEYREGDLCWLETPLNPTGESRWGFLIPLHRLFAYELPPETFNIMLTRFHPGLFLGCD